MFVSNYYVVLVEHEAVIRIFSPARPQSDTPKIATTDTINDISGDDIWRSLSVAQTVTSGCTRTSSKVIQVSNPSDLSIIIQPKTIVGIMSPVTTMPENVVSAVEANSLEIAQA